jgi:long-chain acyl-CoA synthetase
VHSPRLQHVVVCTMGDQLGWLKGRIVNWVVRHVKKLVPAYALPGAIAFADAVAQGRAAQWQRPHVGADDIAALQYTGGTPGVSKGAVLLHRNLLANVLQAAAWFEPALQKIPKGTPPVTVCALPLYHIFAFTVCMMLSLRTGGKVVLVANPRDLPGLFKELRRHTIHVLPAVNTLFNGMVNHANFNTVDWSHLQVAIGGGAPVQSAVAQLWLQKAGIVLCEGYGLSETSPVVAANPVLASAYSGAIGFPLPSTDICLLDDDGKPVQKGQPGEIAIKGPQVMAGYWQRPDETAQVMTADGYFKTGDIGVMDERGCFKIVDRKKDMILVSGFNVYPNELEDVVACMPGVLEVACVGVPDAKTGEAIKLVVVKRDDALTAEAVKAYCKDHLTGYKQPRVIEFRTELPKSPIGKILRRALRDNPA